MRARPPAPSGPAFDDAELAAARERAVAVWTTESGRERDRLLSLPPAARLAALDDDAIRLLLRPEHRAEIRASLTAEPAKDGGGAVTTTWEVERRRLAVLHFARPVAAASYVALALLPFVVAAWRGRMGLWGALGAFLAPGWPLAGVVLALGVAGFLGRLVGRAVSLEGLASLGIGAFVAGVAGLAVSLGFVF